MNKKYLVTGAAGFIGSQLTQRIQEQCHEVLGMDNYNEHLYTSKLKRDRVDHFDIKVLNVDLTDQYSVDELIGNYKPDVIIHLAAMAGVRDSVGNEKDYHKNNIDGTQNLIDSCKKHIPDARILYASTSAIYAGSELPWTEGRETGKQLNAYSYSKWANECQFQSSGLNTTGLRFFTVYGPWGRPDMALFDFTKKILADQEITIYNYGDMKRDFTYIDDILDGIEILMYNDGIPPNDVFNIGRGQQVNLMDFVSEIEKNVGKEAIKQLAPKHPADAQETWSNIEKLGKLGYEPKVSIAEGVSNFYRWCLAYNEVYE